MNESGVELRAAPPRPFVKCVGQQQLLNVDLELRNRTGVHCRLVAVEIDVYGDDGTLSLRRVIDEHGLRPPIETIPERELAPDGELCVVSPFHTFDESLVLTRVCFRVRLATTEAAAVVAEHEIPPVVYRTTLARPRLCRRRPRLDASIALTQRRPR